MYKYLTLFFLLSSFINLSALNANTKLKNNEYSGTVVPITVSTMEYPYDDEMPGIIIYTAKPGTILKGATYSADGKLIKEGDILIKYKINRRRNIYRVRQQELKNSEAAYKFAVEDFNRYKKLMEGAISEDGTKRNIVSRSDYEKSVSNYLKAKADLQKAEIQTIRAEGWMKLTTEHAYFDCIVTDVYIPLGLCAFEDEILTVAQLNPMGIRLDLTREQISKIPENRPITIYPFHEEKPVKAYAFDKIIKDNSLILRVKNNPIPPVIPDKYKQLPTVNRIFPVERFSLKMKDEGLAVPVECIQEDNKGKYVWKASLNKELDTKKYRRILLLNISKIYIKPSDEQRYITPHQMYIRLNNSGDLSTENYILGENKLPENLEKSEQVIFYRKRYTFTPGDPVKVKVEI